MMRTAWLGSAARRSLLPSLPVHQFAVPMRWVQCCADVHDTKLVEQEYVELALNSITYQVWFPSWFPFTYPV
jgi:hypothetical protein